MVDACMKYHIKKLSSGEILYTNGSKKIIIPENSTIKEHQILSFDKNVTEYFGIVLDPSMAVEPHSSVSIFVDLPADIGIYVYNKKYYSIIDKLENFKKRFALYGSASDGMIYRYFKTGYNKTRSKQDKTKIPTNVVINNNSNTWKIVGKIIFKAESLDLFSDKKGIVGERIFFNISDKEFITTKLNNVASESGAKIIPYNISKGIRKIKADVVEMRYGL